MTPDLTAVAIMIVRPTFGHATVTVLIVAWLLCLRFAAATTSDLEKLLGLAVLDALDATKLTVKEACGLMRTDYYHFMQALKGEPGRHISLTCLVRLPFTFWMAFLPILTYLIAKQNITDIAESLGVRRSA